MFDRVRSASGTVLDTPGYYADSDRVVSRARGVIWKLERSQVFSEPNDPAWTAFVDGDWARVIEIFESERGDARAEAASYREGGLELRRLRIVESPPTPYLVWELHSHRIFAECGLSIRVLPAEKVRHLERNAPLPEVMVYGEEALYQVRYDDEWQPAGAKRIDNPELVAGVAAGIAELYEEAEPLLDYFDREIAPLAPNSRQ